MAVETGLDLLQKHGVALSDVVAIAVSTEGGPRLVPLAEAETWLSRLRVHTEPSDDWHGQPSDEPAPPWATIWTHDRVWFFVNYDGIARFRSVPRNPEPWAELLHID